MYCDLALTTDPSQPRDLAISGGRSRLTSGPEAVGQRLWMRLSLVQGEFVLDTSVGLPLIGGILGKGRVTYAESVLSRAVATCPGVAALRSARLEPDRRSRAASFRFDARTADGASVPMDAFRVDP